MRLKNAMASGLVLYSLACHSKSKIDALIAASRFLMPHRDEHATGQSGEYRNRTDDLLHAMQAL